MYECPDWEAFKQAYPDLSVLVAPAVGCSDNHSVIKFDNRLDADMERKGLYRWKVEKNG